MSRTRRTALGLALVFVLAVLIVAEADESLICHEVCVTVCVTETPVTPTWEPTPTPYPTPIPTRPVYCPILVGAVFLGNEPPGTYERMAAAGIELAVHRIFWEPGAIPWAWFDGVLAQSEAVGMDAVLAYWVGGTRVSTASVADEARDIRLVADRYGDRLIGIVVGNEPAHPTWAVDPYEYVHRMRAVYEAVREVDDDLLVISPGLTIESPYEQGWARAWLTGMASYSQWSGCNGTSEGQCFDALALHWYPTAGWRMWPREKVQLARRYLDQYHDSRLNCETPIWVTEWGDVSYKGHQADVIARGLDAWEAEGLDTAVIYRADGSRDTGDDWQQPYFGLTDASLAMLAARLLGR